MVGQVRLSADYRAPYEGLEVDHSQTAPQVISDHPGLQATEAEYLTGHGPETLRVPEKEAIQHTIQNGSLQPDNQPDFRHGFWPRVKKTWKRWITACILLLLAAITLTVGLVVGLRGQGHSAGGESSSTTTSTPASPGTNSAGTRSREGAFNGTGIATLEVITSDIPDFHLFYQDYLGNVQILRESDSQLWSKKTDEFLIASEATRVATPLTAVNYTNGSDMISHLFYVSPQNILQEMVSVDNLTTFTNGTIGDMNIEVSASAKAMTARYGDEIIFDGPDASAGIRLYYGDVDNQVHELIYPLSNSSWTRGFTFPSTNGNAGLASKLVSAAPIMQLYLLNDENELRLWYYRLNGSFQSSDNGTVYGRWAEDVTPAPENIANNSALAFTSGYVFFQQPSGAIAAIATFQGTVPGTWGKAITVGSSSAEYGMIGTSIEAANLTIADSDDWGFHVFYQIDGDDVTENIDDNGVWSHITIPFSNLPIGS